MFSKGLQVFISSVFFVVLTSSVMSVDKMRSEEHQLLDKLKMEMPSVVYREPLAIANLNLNHQGSVIATQPGENVFGMLNFHYDAERLAPESLNQIIIGFSEIGAQKCIFNELGYRCGEGIASFFLQAPLNPGIYEIQCRIEQAYSPKDALIHWVDQDSENVMTIGKLIVREENQN